MPKLRSHQRRASLAPLTVRIACTQPRTDARRLYVSAICHACVGGASIKENDRTLDKELTDNTIAEIAHRKIAKR